MRRKFLFYLLVGILEVGLAVHLVKTHIRHDLDYIAINRRRKIFVGARNQKVKHADTDF